MACEPCEKTPDGFPQVHRKIRAVVVAISLISAGSQLLHLQVESAKNFMGKITFYEILGYRRKHDFLIEQK